MTYEMFFNDMRKATSSVRAWSSTDDFDEEPKPWTPLGGCWLTFDTKVPGYFT